MHMCLSVKSPSPSCHQQHLPQPHCCLSTSSRSTVSYHQHLLLLHLCSSARSASTVSHHQHLSPLYLCLSVKSPSPGSHQQHLSQPHLCSSTKFNKHSESPSTSITTVPVLVSQVTKPRWPPPTPVSPTCAHQPVQQAQWVTINICHCYTSAQQPS